VLRSSIFLVVLVLGGLLMAGCQSQRRFGERTPIAKWYHNFTSHYNGYFNAEELITAAEDELANGQPLNYGKVLPVYPAYSVDDPSSAAPNLDKAMEKVSLVVNIHRPSDYEDDSYLLLGKAQLLKQDFEDAEHTFAYAVKDFDPENETARLRRIEKQKIADGKAREKASRQAGRTTPQRQRPTRKRRSPAPRRKPAAKKKKPSKKKSTPSASGSSSGRDANAKKREEANKAVKKRSKSRKPKSRAEMAREQRERKLAEEKAAAKAEADKLREEQEAAQKIADAEAERLAKLAAGEVPDADAALDDGEGLAAPVTDEEKPKRGPFIHETALQDLNLWLARTYIAREKYVDAERILGQLARSGATFKDVRRRLPAAYADLYIKREKYAEAVPFLEDAIALSRKRADKARYSFILGQLNERLNNRTAAFADYQRVIDLKPDFEMVFHAELNLATTSYRAGTETAEATFKTLEKMAREDKYDEYQGQVFFTMADVALDANQRAEAIGYLQKGLAANQGNSALAAGAYLKLGDLYFEDESYVLASNYYDSTLQVLPREAPNYAEVEAYRDNLKPVAEALTAISLQDSLLAVADLPEEEQRELAARLERERREKAREAAIAESRKAANAPSTSARGRATVGGVQSSFFAYEEKSKRRALKAFERRWGDRPLADNWRTMDSREAFAATEEVLESIGSTDVTDAEVLEILRDVPNDEASRTASNKIIEEALILLGRQYRDKLENPARAAEALEDLLRRYPNSSYTAEALYLGALAYDDLRRPADAKRLRDRLVAEQADSKYAQSIANPEFLDGARAKEKRLVAYYDQTYQLFENGDAQQALSRIDSVESTFGADHGLRPRFALLRALVMGKTKGKEAYVAELRKVVAGYPAAEEATRAKEILRLLGERAGIAGGLDKAAKTSENGETADLSRFVLEPDKSHYFLAAIDKSLSTSEAKAAVADYNEEFHRLEKLAIGNVYMMNAGEQTPVIVIRRFRSQAEAMDYYASVTGNTDAYLKGNEFTPLIISQGNYREVLRSKSLGDYLQYFQQNYL